MIPQLPPDKAGHWVAGSFIACIVSLLLGPWWALIAVSAAAILKELHDAWQNYKASGDPLVGPHGVELMDIVATLAGGLMVIAPQLVKRFL